MVVLHLTELPREGETHIGMEMVRCLTPEVCLSPVETADDSLNGDINVGRTLCRRVGIDPQMHMVVLVGWPCGSYLHCLWGA